MRNLLEIFDSTRLLVKIRKFQYYFFMKILISAVLLLSFSAFAFSQSSEPNAPVSLENETAENKETQIDSSLIVSKINFIGLKKTRNSYIQSKVSKFTGKSIAETDIHALETAIQLEDLFDDIQISTEQTSETEAQVTVFVKEKITFVPLPFAMYSSSGFVAGGLVMDTNAFGQKDMFMLGGFFSNTSKTAMASFTKQSKTKGVPTISLFVIGSKSSPEWENLDDDIILKYDAFSFNANLKLSEKLSEHFSFSNGYGFKYLSTDDASGYAGFSPESITAGSVFIGLDYSKSDWNGVFMSTNSVSILAEVGFTNSDDKDYRFPLRFSFAVGEQHPIFTKRLRMYQHYSGFYGRKNHLSDFRGRGDGSVLILPGDFATEKIIGGNAGLEVAIAKFNWGMISLYSDYQVVFTQDFDIFDEGDYEFHHGPNGGAKIYLAKIAFPALAMGVSYNVRKNYWQFAAAMGMSF